MTVQHVNAISGRLSLRPPQRDSLRILHRMCELVRFDKDIDCDEALKAIQAEYPSVEEFERDFPSLCFQLATGVGKTRLMDAFIAYLYRAENIRHFFVLAPNLTIYNKLIADFTPNTPKYVFTGINEFTLDPPEIITCDNYEGGRGVRRGRLFDEDVANINIFNISKINTEVRGGKAPRIKRLSEYVGKSYFDYLSSLDDLVLLMDESHRYRAKAGMRVLNELKPILGLELTATPQVTSGQRVTPFKNVIFSYPLSMALDDGFVKEPAVATRENFKASDYNVESLERLKLEDGVHIHEETKVQLDVFSRENDRPRVKPFVLVVAKDIEHASQLKAIIESDEFFDGQYKGKVAEVHSKQSSEEKDENVQRLLAVESPDDPTEIVIHVDKLKEGWDVTNLYTIIPLRAFNSRNLIEQAVGRGLRLPYGKRVGVPAVDRLTIVSHDKFQELVDEAKDKDSIIRAGIKIGTDIPDEKSQAVTAGTSLEREILGTATDAVPSDDVPVTEQKPLFDTEADRHAAMCALAEIKHLERLGSSNELLTKENQSYLVEKVRESIRVPQQQLPHLETVNVEQVVKEVTEKFVVLSIDIPKVIIVPSDDAAFGYNDFELDCAYLRLQPVDQDILIQHLHDEDRYKLQNSGAVSSEERLENYLVRELVDFDDISYDDNATLLYKLSGQMVEHVQSYLDSEDKVLNVLIAHNRQLVDTIYSQMQQHYYEHASSSEVKITKGFHTLRSNHFTAPAGENIRNYRELVEEKRFIRSMLFGGFSKCLYDVQKFDSDTERRLSVILETDDTVLKWFKPARNVFQIYYRVGTNEGNYEPDFVVETDDAKYLCEPKSKDEMDDPIVIAKANAAATWCENASTVGGNPWSYLLIPHDAVTDAMNMSGLAATHRFVRR